MMAVLLVLYQANGEAVTKQALLEAVWSDVVVSDLILSRAVTDLRKVFNETAKNAMVIKTIPKVGYCMGSTNVYTAPDEKSGPKVGIFPATKTAEVDKKPILLSIILLFVLTGVGLLIYGQWQQPSQPIQLIPHNITADIHRESQPRYSPSGNTIVYIARNKQKVNTSSLVLYSTQSKTSTTLVTFKGLIESPTFSPDESTVAYYARTNTSCELMLLNVSSLKTRSTSCLPRFKFNLDWSSDKDWILTGHGNLGVNQEGLALINASDFSVKTIAKPDEDGAKYLFARLSPDATKVATTYFHRTSNRWKLGVIDVQTGAFTVLLEIHRAINQVVWSKHDNLLYYVIASGQHGGIWQFDMDSNKEKRLYSGDILDLDYSRVLNQFVMVEQQKDLNLWAFDLHGAPLEEGKDVLPQSQVTFGSKKEHQPAHYKEQNTGVEKIAYISNQTNANNLWVKDLSTGIETQWTYFEDGMLADVQFSGDGQTVYFNYSLKSLMQAYYISSPKTPALVFEPNHSYRMFSLSADDRFIYFSSDVGGKWQTHEKNLNTGQSEVILDFIVNDLYSRGDDLYYKRFNDTQMFKATRVNGELESVDLDPSRGFYGTWRLVNNNIYFISQEAKSRPKFYRYNLVTKIVDALSEIRISYSVGDVGFAVTKDESAIYYTRLEHQKVDVIGLDVVD